jgi:hypothetical protein
MTEEQFNALLALIDAKVAEAFAANTSDSGLVECIRANKCEDEARKLLVTEEE